MHRLFYKGIDEKYAGVWRDTTIFVTGTDYVFPLPEKINEEINVLETWIKQERKKYHPIKFAALLHLKFVTIHPFIDGNGRVSRLLMNLALIQDGHLLAIIPPILRYEYMSAIIKYQQKNIEKDFCDLIAERVYESQKEIIRLLQLKSD
jgi:Fic family protein